MPKSIRKIGRDGGIRTHDPLTPSQRLTRLRSFFRVQPTGYHPCLRLVLRPILCSNAFAVVRCCFCRRGPYADPTYL